MRKEYKTPEVEIEKFPVYLAPITTSLFGGNEDGDTEIPEDELPDTF